MSVWNDEDNAEICERLERMASAVEDSIRRQDDIVDAVEAIAGLLQDMHGRMSYGGEIADQLKRVADALENNITAVQW
jgi:predicted DNA-binding protein YlxM (UPF0122 family)